MATPPPGRKNQTICVFFEKGSCRSGDTCRFTHGASDKRELHAGVAAGRVSVPAAEEPKPASEPNTKKKWPCRFFAKGKCAKGEKCPFLHCVGDGSGSSTDGESKDAPDKPTAVKAKAKTNTNAKPNAKPKVKVKVNTSARIDGGEGDEGAPAVTAAKRAAAASGAAADADAARVAAGGPRVKPRLLGGISSSLPSKAGGGAAKAASHGGPAGSWAGIVKRTAPTDTDRASTSGGGGSTSTSSTVSASTTSSIDGDVPAAVAPTAAHVKALKAAHQTAKKAARAAAASAAASAGRGGGAAAGAAAAVVVVADNACISDTFSAVDPTSRTAGPQRRKQHHNQQHQQHQQTGSTSGSADKHKEKKTRAKTKPCTFFPRGRCRYGDGCRFSHDVAHESAQEKEEEEEKEEEDMLEAHEAALDNAERIESRKVECGVCLEVVRKVKRTKDRRFGILMGCRHIYCLSCITEWRDKSKSHECPECRVPSSLVVPSKSLVTDPDRKARLVSSFRKSLASVG